MIRGRAEKRTDPAVVKADEAFASMCGAMYLRDVIARIERQESGCCHKTVIERCEGCPYATVNS